MATYSSNTTLRVNRAISGATTVNASGYAVVDYQIATGGTAAATIGAALPLIITRYFGPSQSIPANFSGTGLFNTGGTHTNVSVQYNLLSGVEFINSP